MKPLRLIVLLGFPLYCAPTPALADVQIDPSTFNAIVVAGYEDDEQTVYDAQGTDELPITPDFSFVASLGGASASIAGSFGLVGAMPAEGITSLDYIATLNAGPGQAEHELAQGYLHFVFHIDTPTAFSLIGEATQGMPFSGAVLRRAMLPEEIFRVELEQHASISEQGVLEPGDYFIRTDAINLQGIASYRFQLTFGGYRWIDPAGGDWDVSDNWSAGQAPGANDTAEFNLASAYTVTFAQDVQNEILVVSDGDVRFNLASQTYSLEGAGSAGPDGALRIEKVGGGAAHLTVSSGNVNLDSGFFFTRRGHGQVSLLDGAELATLTAVMAIEAGSTADLTVSGINSRFRPSTLSVAVGGVGIITVDGEGAVSTGHMTIGSNANSIGQVTISGENSDLTVFPGAGRIGVGDGVFIIGIDGEGSIAVLDGAQAKTGRTNLGSPVLDRAASRGSAVISGAGTVWENADAFNVGDGGRSDLFVDQGARLVTGELAVFGSREIVSTVPVARATFSGAQTRLEASGAVSASAMAQLTFEQTATFTAQILHANGGTIILNGVGTSGEVHGSQTAVQVFRGGTLIIEDGANLESTSVRHIIGAGTTSPDDALVHVRGLGSTWDMGLTDLLIAINEFGVEGGSGELRLEDDAQIVAHDILVGTGGRITGSDSTIIANVDLLGGTIAPGLSPGTLTITGNFRQGQLGSVEIEIGGVTPGTQHDVLNVSGDISIEGHVVLKFIDGFAPQQGQTFEFLTVGGTANVSGASFDIQNLAPGFMFEIAPSAGGIMMTALNDGVYLLPGDHNADGSVDASDYVAWRKSDSSPDGYNTWRTNFGRSAAAAGATAGPASSAHAAVPEPACCLMLLSVMLACIHRPRGIAIRRTFYQRRPPLG